MHFIAELPIGLQVKLLRVLEEHTVLKLGAVEEKKLDIRIIASTNKNLHKEMEKGNFRSDLYYRLNVVPVVIPPLRVRKGDVQDLLEYYLRKNNERYGMNRILAGDALDALLNYRWPGNVRELANLMQRLVIINSKDIIEFENLPNYITAAHVMSKGHERIRPRPFPQPTEKPLRELIDSYERMILKSFLQNHERHEDAASALKISMSTLTRKIRKYRLNKPTH